MWRTPRYNRQDDMDRDLPGILQQWREVVTRLRWSSPEDPHRIMDCTGMGPSGWRTTTLTAIQHPHRCAALITKLKRMLHGRQRCLLRKQISFHAAHLETLRAQIKSTLGRRRPLHPGIPPRPWRRNPHQSPGHPQYGHSTLHTMV